MAGDAVGKPSFRFPCDKTSQRCSHTFSQEARSDGGYFQPCTFRRGLRSAPAGPLMTQERVIHVVQGEFVVSGDANAMLTTVLGSCVSACIYDPALAIGGMNHFLLPGGAGRDDMRFASASMERLVNGLLRHGARRSRLRAKLFGGARMIASLMDIGRRNGDAALQFLHNEGIDCISASLGGNRARRVRFWPASGRAQQLLLDPSVGDPLVPARFAPGPVELFSHGRPSRATETCK